MSLFHCLSQRSSAWLNFSALGLACVISSTVFATPASIMDYYQKNITYPLPFTKPDQDGDGVPNVSDAFPRNASEWLDTDHDGIGDNADLDDDGDGMPDTWELAYGLNPLVNDANADSDHDGSSNLQEYLNNTNPNLVTSCSGACVFAPAPVPGAITFPTVDTVSDQVGTLPGIANVSNSGAVEYTIPLDVPAGTGGVAPKLALSYRSNGGNGILGVGWSLGALSAITRCPNTLAQEGMAREVRFDSSDKFCIDGEKLVLLNPNALYGANGVEYRTQTDSFKKIVSYGSTGGGPTYFRVWNKDGSVSEYGNTQDSKLTPIYMTSTIIWAQNRIEDANSYATSANNPVIYQYESVPTYSGDFSNPTNEDLRISRIDYGYGNTSLPSVSVNFTYGTRLDVAFNVFNSGITRGHDKRLTQISMNSSGSEIRKYTFAYKNVSSSQPYFNKSSFLDTISECGGATCLPATKLIWSNNNPNTLFTFAPAGNVLGFSTFPFGLNTKLNKFAPADFNGDGKSDLVWLEQDASNFRFVVSLSNGSTLGTTSTESQSSHNISSWIVMDYDMDGFPDVLFTENGSLKFYKNTNVSGQRSIAVTAIELIANLDMSTEPGLNGTWSTPKAIFADINGDGLTDILYDKAIYYLEKDVAQTNGPYKYGSANVLTIGDPLTPGTMNFSARNALASIGAPEYFSDLYRSIDMGSANFSGDFNGDGLPDLLVKAMFQGNSSSYSSWGAWEGASVLFLNNGSGGYTYKWSGLLTYYGSSAYQHFIVDFNSDGKSDLIGRQPNSYMDNWSVLLSNVYGLSITSYYPFDYTSVAVPPETFNNFLAQNPFVDVTFQDMNMDGYPDMVYRNVRNGNDVIRAVINRGGSGQFLNPMFSSPAYMDIPGENFGTQIFMDINGDGIADLVDLGGQTWLGTKASGTAWNKITKITNGLGEEINIEYKQLTDPAVYIREFDAPSINSCYTVQSTSTCYPVFDIFAPITVVSAVSTSSPIEGNANNLHTTSYQYQGLKVQPAGRGSFGFHKMRVADSDTGTVVSKTFRQDFPFIGLLADTQTYLSGQTTPLSETVNTYSQLPHINGAVKPPYLVALTQSLTTQRIAESTGINSPVLTVNGVLTTTTTSQSNFDSYGNPGTVSVAVTGDGSTYTITTANTYSNTPSTWLLGKLTHSVVTRQQGSASITRTTDFTYDSYGRLLTQVREPQGSTVLKLTTSYEYDAFGNPNKITESAAAGTRYSRMVYDSTGRFVDKTYNGLEQLVSEVISRDAFGQPTEIRGLNGVRKYARYGTFGRQYFAAANDGAQTTTLYRLCSQVSCPAGAMFRVQSTGNDGSLSNSYADKLGRKIRSEVKSFSGSLSISDTVYDSVGRVKKASVPYFSGNTVYWSTNDYDNLGRVIKAVDPQGGIATNQFSRYQNGTVVGIQQLSKNALNQSKTTLTNGRNQTLKVIDNLSGTIDYSFDAAGNLVQLVSNGVTSSIGYDLLDRKTSLNDPDQGNWQYMFNAFGEMTDQQDSNGGLTSTSFDALGRLVARQDHRANMTQESNATWVYGADAAKNNVGQLVTEMDSASGYIKVYGYDTLGRPYRTVTSLGQNGADGDYAQYATYDQYGRPFQQIDATNKGVQYVYNTNGYQEKLVEASNSTHVYQQVTQTNARGQVTAESLHDAQFQLSRTYNAQTGLANTLNATSNYSLPRTLVSLSLAFDAVGNLSSRTRNVQAEGALPAKTLSETFTYDQLNRLTAIAASGASTQNVGYDLSGNITSKSGVGSYSYNSARPHAVASAGSDNYSYDAVGNMLNGGGRAAVYNTFRKPTQITKGSHTTSFEYGPDRSHFKRLDNTGVNITKTLYVGNVEFIQIDAGPIKTKRYIGGSMVVTDFNGTHEEHALFTDHLGSTVAMAKANSLDFNQEDYDAFGKRRNLWTVNELVAADKVTLNKLSTKGFTGHEMLDEVGLIHMKGRVYDPNLGRFLSADPFITELDNTQNMNRYSYVYNNPLTLKDPNGFEGIPTELVNYTPGMYTFSPSTGSGSVGGTGGVPGLGQPGVSVVDCGGGCNIFGSVSIPDNSGIMNAALSGYALQMIMQQEAIQAQKALDIANATVQQILNQMRGISLSIAGVPAESIQAIQSATNDTTVTSGVSSDSINQGGCFLISCANAKDSLVTDAQKSFQNNYGDILKAGNIDINQNVKDARSISFLEWLNKVRSGGDWDYKNNQLLIDAGISRARLDEFGNVHFGIVANAYGFNLEGSMYGAGAYQVLVQGGGNSSDLDIATKLLTWTYGGYAIPDVLSQAITNAGFTWGDNVGDAINIMNGWNYAQQNYQPSH